MNDAPRKAPLWVEQAVSAMPEKLTDDELAAFLLTVVTTYGEGPKDIMPLLLSLSLTYAKVVNMPMSLLKSAYDASGKSVGEIIARESSRMN